jgi:FKBP-type peptidyl-prolyl cis-trans isomerase
MISRSHVLAALIAVAGAPLLTACQQDRTAVTRELRPEEAEKMKAQEAAAAASKAFLEANKAKAGVVTTESGLQYEKVRALAGDGPRPTPADTVVADYEGTLADGTKFDSSYDRGEPAEFPLGGVIPGWTEALQLMRPGEEFRLVIPPELAYGADGAGAMIGPNEVLVFKVELRSFTRPDGTTVKS